VAAAASGTFDPIIYPGLYSASGFNIIGILVCRASAANKLIPQTADTSGQVTILQRDNPQVDLGPVDASVPLVLCDLKQPDQPIVYASEAFAYLTGYSQAEILGRNCRFLQAPGGNVRPRSARRHVDSETIKKMRKAVDRNRELRIEVVNFKKDGTRFVNVLTMIPVKWNNNPDYNYSVGFQMERE
jgi:PAS domain S-box-containing protein